jgi:hypothetical protein
MKERELNETERNAARNVSSLLWAAFPWTLTPQGSRYWFEVSLALDALATLAKPKKCEKCGQVVPS